MARVRATARKSTEGREVPRHQLASREEESNGSRPSRGAEIRRLNEELRKANQAQEHNVALIDEL